MAGGERRGRRRREEEGGEWVKVILSHSVLCGYHGDSFIDDNIANDSVRDKCGCGAAAPVGGADLNAKTGYYDN